MNVTVRGMVLLLGLFLITQVSGCSKTEPHQQEVPPDAPSAAASSNPKGLIGSLFDDDANLDKGTQVADTLTEAPQGELQPVGSFVQGDYTNNSSLQTDYWASDWCHYIVGADGVTHGDSCARAAVDANGNPSSVQFVIYQYDPSKQDKLGSPALELYTGYPGYTTFRNLNDPLFNQVQWAAFPTGVANLTRDNFMVSFLGDDGTLRWYSTQQILDMASAAKISAGVPQATVPAWDPAITVWSYSMIMSINNRIADIPSAAY